MRGSNLFEAVPNLSEGRRPEVVAALAGAVREVTAAALLDVSADPDHNRSVLTLAGPEAALHEALLALAAVAVERIDLRHHAGAHPRIGALDVVPFVPLGRATMEEAVAAARRFAAAIAARHALPVFLYAEAATRPERRALADLRRGGLEALGARLATGAWEPDFGPRRLHPSAGAVAVGARPFLVAFNAVLAGPGADLEAARSIARAVRESGGGLAGVRALGFDLPSRARAQVSMNLVDLARVTPAAALARVRREAAARGLDVEGCELVGLAPREAFRDASPEALGIPPDRILEDRLRAAGLEP